MLQRIERFFNFKLLKEEIRKIGVNLVTAGTVGIFITHITGLTLIIMTASVWVIVVGVIGLLFGIYRGVEL